LAHCPFLDRATIRIYSRESAAQVLTSKAVSMLEKGADAYAIIMAI
jgi:hypothetical protein